MSCIYLLLGSNQGHRMALLQQAISLLELHIGVIEIVTKVYETAAWGKVQQPSFLNQVVKMRTQLPPYSLLQKIQLVETLCGRQRKELWGQRTMDIDLLFYDDLVINDPPLLVVPHPLIPVRNFVLTPLAEIAPTLVHPVLSQQIDTLLAHCPDELSVTVCP